MGFFSSLFGGKTKNTTKSTVDVDPKYKAFLDRNLDVAQNAFTGFNPYANQDQRYADFTQDELTAFDRFRDISSPDSLASQVGQSSLRKFLGAPTLDDLRPYTDPFADAVIDRSAQRIYDAYDKRLADVRKQAADQGAFGGSRFAVAESNLIENLGQEVGDLAYRGYSDAFNQGIDRYYNTGLQGLNAAGAAQDQDVNRAQLLQQVGGTQRALDQSRRDFDFNEFLRGEDTSRSDALSLVNVGSAYPRDIFSRTDVQTQTSSPSLFNTIAGLSSAAAGAVTGTGGGGLFGALGGSSGGGGSQAAPGVNAGGFSTNAFSLPTGQNPFYTPGSISSTFSPIGAGYAEGGKISKDGQSARMFISPEDQEMIQDYYDQQRRMSGINPRVKPVPQSNPFVNAAPPAPKVNPFKPKEIVEAVKTKEEPADNRNWKQRWLDNPLTQLGLTLLAGENNALGRSSEMFLSQRSSELEQQRQEEMLAAQQAAQEAVAAQKAAIEQAKLEREYAYKDAEAAARAREAALDRENKLAVANAQRASRSETDPTLKSIQTIRDDFAQQIRSIDQALANMYPSPDNKQTIAELKAERDKLMRSWKDTLEKEKMVTGLDYGYGSDEDTVQPTNNDDPLELNNDDPLGLYDE